MKKIRVIRRHQHQNATALYFIQLFTIFSSKLISIQLSFSSSQDHEHAVIVRDDVHDDHDGRDEINAPKDLSAVVQPLC